MSCFFLFFLCVLISLRLLPLVLPHDDNVDSVKTCTIHENDIKESFNSLHMEEKHKDDHSETENSQCEKLT
jgi:hypothetical protein